MGAKMAYSLKKEILVFAGRPTGMLSFTAPGNGRSTGSTTE
jgi:hypothetical protein